MGQLNTSTQHQQQHDEQLHSDERMNDIEEQAFASPSIPSISSHSSGSTRTVVGPSRKSRQCEVVLIILSILCCGGIIGGIVLMALGSERIGPSSASACERSINDRDATVLRHQSVVDQATLSQPSCQLCNDEEDACAAASCAANTDCACTAMNVTSGSGSGDDLLSDLCVMASDAAIDSTNSSKPFSKTMFSGGFVLMCICLILTILFTYSWRERRRKHAWKARMAMEGRVGGGGEGSEGEFDAVMAGGRNQHQPVPAAGIVGPMHNPMALGGATGGL